MSDPVRSFGGRVKITDEQRDWLHEAQARMRRDHPANTDWLIATRENEDAPWDVRARIAIHLDNKIRSDPPRLIAAAVSTHNNIDDLPQNGAELDRLADAYALMLGATVDRSPMIDITPSRSRSALTSPTVTNVTVEELRQIAAEQRQRIRRPQSSVPERIRRPRRRDDRF